MAITLESESSTAFAGLYITCTVKLTVTIKIHFKAIAILSHKIQLSTDSKLSLHQNKHLAISWKISSKSLNMDERKFVSLEHFKQSSKDFNENDVTWLSLPCFYNLIQFVKFSRTEHPLFCLA